MTVQALPWAIQGQSHSAEVARNALAALAGVPVAAHTPAVSVTTAGGGHGVVNAGDLAVTQNGTPNMSVNVAAGRALIRSGETASILAGVWSFLNDATVNLAVAAADPTNPRRDLVIAQVRDANYSGGSNDARLTVVTGTPAASPVDPTVPNNALVLARIQVAAGATSITNANITDLRTFAHALGGVGLMTSAVFPASPPRPSVWVETDTGELWLWNGSGWRQIIKEDSTLDGANLSAGSVSAGKIATLANCRLRRAANQSIGAGATATINWDTEDADASGLYPGSGGTITIPSGQGGFWSIAGRIIADGTMTNACVVAVTAAGVDYRYWINAGQTNGAFAVPGVLLGVGATVSVSMTNGHTGSRNFTGNFEMVRLGNN